jgi:hypothetical protein
LQRYSLVVNFLLSTSSARIIGERHPLGKEDPTVNKAGVFLGLLVVVAVVGSQAPAIAAPQDQDQNQESAKAEKTNKGLAFKSEKGTVSGTLSVVAADKNFVSVKDSSGTSFGFQVKPSTKITAGGQKTKLADLSSATNKQATITYRSLRTGNVAQSIEVSQ